MRGVSGGVIPDSLPFALRGGLWIPEELALGGLQIALHRRYQLTHKLLKTKEVIP
jgi:hypothetical protein